MKQLLRLFKESARIIRLSLSQSEPGDRKVKGGDKTKHQMNKMLIIVEVG